MPSASTAPVEKASTSLNARTSRRRRGAAARSRNRFEVSFASPTGPAAALSCAARASFFCECALSGLLFKLVEEVARHGVARPADVALGEDDLEEVRASRGRAEHLGAAVEVDAPDAPEALVEAARVERADGVPMLVEALGPDIERERVMAAQVLDVEHLEAGLLHLDDDIGEARDPAAGKDVLPNEVIGVEAPDVTDEVNQAKPAFFERARVRLDQIDQPIASRVLEAADRDHLVVLAIHRAEVRFERDGVP